MRKKLTYASGDTGPEAAAGYENALARILPELGRTHPLLIGGTGVFSGPEFEVRPPFDRHLLVGKFQTATPSLIREAIAVAHRGFPAWQERDWRERAGDYPEDCRHP